MRNLKKPTIQNIDKILQYLPYFQNRENEFYKVDIEVSLLDPYIYSEEVKSFIRSIYDENFLKTFDWPEWQKEAQKYIENLDALQSADISIIKKLLTLHARKERFCSGHVAIMIEEGHILNLLRRLKEIREKMDKK